MQRKAEKSIGWVSKTAEEAGRDRGMALVRHDDGQKFSIGVRSDRLPETS